MATALILTAGFGEGHNTAARNLTAAIQQAGGTAITLDAFSAAYPRSNAVARRIYLALINRFPALWRAVYAVSDSSGSLVPGPALLAKAREAIADALATHRPDVLLSTYPIYSALMADRPANLPLITIVTDSISINATWYRAPSDHFIAPNEETRAILVEKGVPPECVRCDGFPVDARFSNTPTRGTPSPANPFRALLVINSARPDPRETTAALLEISDIRLTVTAGRDEALARDLKEIAGTASGRAEILGWTTEMPNLMLSHHLLIGKAGGATVQESIAAKLPMLVSRVVPGQEAGNAELLVRNHCGALAETPEEIVRLTRHLLADNASPWQEWHRNISRISRPNAAADIARFALECASR